MCERYGVPVCALYHVTSAISRDLCIYTDSLLRRSSVAFSRAEVRTSAHNVYSETQEQPYICEK